MGRGQGINSHRFHAESQGDEASPRFAGPRGSANRGETTTCYASAPTNRRVGRVASNGGSGEPFQLAHAPRQASSFGAATSYTALATPRSRQYAATSSVSPPSALATT